MKKYKWVLLLTSSLLLFACNTSVKTGRQVESFSFTDQTGNPYGSEDLKGKIWVADFIFTQCKTVCPPMTFEMAELQKKFKDQGMDTIEFVSFTVDPDVDTPEVLKEYIDQYTDDDDNWHLLTGYSQNTIEQIALNQFQTIVQKPNNSSQVIHGTNFYLIDQNGYIVDEYNLVDESFSDRMMDDIRRLQK